MDKQQVSEIALQLSNLIPIFHRRVMTPLENQLKTSLSILQRYTLMVLNEEGPKTMSELSAKMVTSKQQMTPIVDKLFSEGYVQRKHDDYDRRNVQIIITTAGIDFIENHKQDISKEIHKRIEDLDPDDLHTLQRSLVDLYTILNKL